MDSGLYSHVIVVVVLPFVRWPIPDHGNTALDEGLYQASTHHRIERIGTDDRSGSRLSMPMVDLARRALLRWFSPQAVRKAAEDCPSMKRRDRYHPL